MSEYNGWKNWETWNVALWLQNDEGLYRLARSTEIGNYRELARILHSELGMSETPDGVQWNYCGLDFDSLDEMLSELRGGIHV